MSKQRKLFGPRPRDPESIRPERHPRFYTGMSWDEDKYLRYLCRQSFKFFVQTFWEHVPGAGQLIWNWHMDVICDELQAVAERVFRNEPKEHDLILNVPPGTSKSTLGSILFQAWCWTRMPGCRHICGSHSSDLALDLATKCRDVMRSDLYRRLFSEVEVVETQDTKAYYRNTLGGDRYTCTVGGRSPIGFHAHIQCCLPWQTDIITDAGPLPIGLVVDFKLPVRVLSYDHGRGLSEWAEIEEYEPSQGRPLVRIVFNEGVLEATADHPVYVRGRGYVPADSLQPGDEVICADNVRPVWGESLPQPCSRGEGGVRAAVLYEQLQMEVHDGGRTPCLCGGDRQGLRGVRQEVCGYSLPQFSEVLQPELPPQLDTDGSSLQRREGRTPLWKLWQTGYPSSRPVEGQKVLLSDVCESSALQSYEGHRESELHTRHGGWGVFGGVQEALQTGTQAGASLLLSLREDQAGEREESGCASHRLGQDERLHGEFGSDLHVMSQGHAGEEKKERTESKRVVLSVERAVRIPNTVYNVRVAKNHNYFANGVLVHNCDDPIDPKEVLSETALQTAREFFTNHLPGRKVNREVTVTILIMQRLGVGDPTDVMMDISKREGASPVRHVCLPAELTEDVNPPELAQKYANGVLDSNRLPKHVLDRERATMGEHAYQTQFLQRASIPGGSMFRAEWFNKRVKAAPYDCKRIRYWDRASSIGSSACNTAGVLMAVDGNGTVYVEDVVVGKWEPVERNKKIRATAIRDRSRYGPKHEPKIYVEAEGGSSGRDAWIAIARSLSGFPVREDRPTGSKDTRAEPWAWELAAGNVYIVDNGESAGQGTAGWDIAAYVDEHEKFRPSPGQKLGRLKDRIDSSSGCYNLLKGAKSNQGLKTYNLGRSRNGPPVKVILATREQLACAHILNPTILVSIQDPSQETTPELPPHALVNLIASVVVWFADLDPYDAETNASWDDPDPETGIAPSQLAVSKEACRKMWGVLTRKYPTPPEIIIIQGEDDGRHPSVGMAVCDALHFRRDQTLSCLESDDNRHKGDPPNRYVYDVVREGRKLVM